MSQLNSLLIRILSTQNSRQNSGKIGVDWRPGFLQDLQLSLDVVGASCSLNPKGESPRAIDHISMLHMGGSFNAVFPCEKPLGLGK